MSVELEAAINPNAVFGYPSIRDLSDEDRRSAEEQAAEHLLQLMYSGAPLQERYAFRYNCQDRTFRCQAVYRFATAQAIVQQ